MEDYQKKYLKYKTKYLYLKNQIGGVSIAEFETLARNIESAKRRDVEQETFYDDDSDVYESDDEENKEEQSVLEEQLKTLGIYPVKPTAPILLPPDKFKEMQKLFKQAQQNRIIMPSEIESNNDQEDISEDEQEDISEEERRSLEEQLKKLYNEPLRPKLN